MIKEKNKFTLPKGVCYLCYPKNKNLSLPLPKKEKQTSLLPKILQSKSE